MIETTHTKVPYSDRCCTVLPGTAGTGSRCRTLQGSAHNPKWRRRL
ncbi:unnamed protein product [Staurois parvus]|uniref:Uncharacterized protein n=1 Tax=Staurois parvus TaxID=386267 RepID=A0ABN9E3E5_9NEOB|nr:unnamed protein product [Staurois parvus]